MLCKEVLLWRQLRHRHLLEFIGVCVDVFHSPAIVSPWLENGNVLQFVKTKPGAFKLGLVRQTKSLRPSPLNIFVTRTISLAKSQTHLNISTAKYPR